MIYWVGAFIIVYHLLKYGITNKPRRIATIFLAGSIVLSIISFMLYTQIDWQKIFPSEIMKQKTQLNIKK